LNRYGPIEQFPPDVLGENRPLALRFKELATLRSDAALFAQVEQLRWGGPTGAFAEWTVRIGDSRLLERAHKARPAQSDPITAPERP
jgi:hypothetical protein